MVAVEIEETEAAADAIAGNLLSLTSQKVANGRVAIFQDVSRATRHLSFSSAFPLYNSASPLSPYGSRLLPSFRLMRLTFYFPLSSFF